MAADPILYVSWGGTGRAASVRQAMQQAIEEARPLTYLAVLDDEHFGDLDQSMIALVADELEWLLDAQLELTRSQLRADDLELSVEVVTGRVVELVISASERLGVAEVLIGAPVPVAGHESIQSMIDQIARRTGSAVQLVAP